MRIYIGKVCNIKESTTKFPNCMSLLVYDQGVQFLGCIVILPKVSGPLWCLMLNINS